MESKYAINSLFPEELKNWMIQIGESAFRAKQLFHFFHKEQLSEIEKATVFPKQFIEKIRKEKMDKIVLWKRVDSKKDNTKKYLFKLQDDHYIESVYLDNQGNHSTLCLSTQVGCRMGCHFCASTKQAFIRGLTSTEILLQVYEIERDLNCKVNNIVLMGIGEPFDNYEAVVRFLKLLHHPDGHHMSYRNMTVSTCGLVNEILKFSLEEIPLNLTISLHSGFDKDRQLIMPIAKKYSISQILNACDVYFQRTGRRISFEYTLIHDVNDTMRDINQLVKLFKNKSMHINLIPLNEIDEYNKQSPSTDYIENFQQELIRQGINATIRKSQGADIQGACGQLRGKETKGEDIIEINRNN